MAGDEKGKLYIVQENGKEGRRYDAISSETLAFSPNGDNIAYVARRGPLFGGKYFLIVNDGEGGDYDEVTSLDFQYLGVPSLFQFRRYYQMRNRLDPWNSDTEVSYLAWKNENVYLVIEQVNK